MSLAFGVLFLTLGILMMRMAQLACQRPIPPRWVRDSEVSTFVAPLIVSLLAFGIGFFVHYLTTPSDHFNWMLAGGMIAANMVIFAVLWKYAQTREQSISTNNPAIAPATPLLGKTPLAEGPVNPIIPPAGGKGQGKRAA